MRIAMLSAASSIHTARWANALTARGIEVHLISLHKPRPVFDASVIIHMLPSGAPAGYVTETRRLRRMLEEIAPDVFNVHYATGYGLLGRSAAFVPTLLSVWGSDVFEFPHKSPIHRSLVRMNLESSTAIASTSEAMARQIRRIAPRIQNVFVTPFGVDRQRFSPIDHEREKSQKKSLVIGTVKALEDCYGVDVLIRAFRQLLDCPDIDPGRRIILRIFGDGSKRRELKTLSAALGVAGRVEFHGKIAHELVPDALRAMDVFVALSRSESFGVAVLEASACGVPVIASDVGGLPEVVVQGKTGFLVPANDVEAATDAMKTLLVEPDLRLSLGRNGVQFVADEYDWDKCVSKLINAYAETIKIGESRSVATMKHSTI